MVLKALVDLYEQLTAEGLLAKQGWASAKVGYVIDLDENGQLRNIVSVKTPKQTAKKEVLLPAVLEVPQPVKRSSGIAPNFLVDNATYTLGIDLKGNPGRANDCFEAFRKLTLEVLKDADSPCANAVKSFVSTWKPELAKGYDAITENMEGLMTDNLTFTFMGVFAIDDPEIKRCWQQYYDRDETAKKIICSVTGREDSLAILHPAIKGVAGGQSTGTNLVSFNAPSFCSFEQSQGENANIGKYAATAYTAALNFLIADKEHTRLVGDTTIVTWANGGTAAYQDLFAASIYGEVDTDTGFDLTLILDAISKGNFIQWNGVELDPDVQFYVLGLAPNAARLSVRFFYSSSFGDMLKNIAKHYDRLKIIRPTYDKREYLTTRSLFRETMSDGEKDVLPTMAIGTLQAILNDTLYPDMLFKKTMLRIKAEHKVTRGRAAIIKAYYLKNLLGKNEVRKEDLQVELNTESNTVAYNLGRLFAILEYVQDKSSTETINATIRDKYLVSASTTPARAFPGILRLHQHHLKKLSPGSRYYYSEMVREIMQKLDSFPKVLNVTQQGEFYLAYYQQMNEFYPKKQRGETEEQ